MSKSAADKLVEEESRYEHGVQNTRKLIAHLKSVIHTLEKSLMATQDQLDAITQGFEEEEEKVAQAIVNLVSVSADLQSQLDAANDKIAAGDALVQADVDRLQAAKDKMDAVLETIPGAGTPPA